jgi:hypothetical protein
MRCSNCGCRNYRHNPSPDEIIAEALELIKAGYLSSTFDTILTAIYDLTKLEKKADSLGYSIEDQKEFLYFFQLAASRFPFVILQAPPAPQPISGRIWVDLYGRYNPARSR